MRKLTQKELLQEGLFANAVRSAGRALKSIYSPVFEPIAPVAKGIYDIGNRPVRALKDYLKKKSDIRLMKVVSVIKTKGADRQTGYGKYTGPEIYQITFTGQKYNKDRGIYEATASTLPPPSQQQPTYTPPPAVPSWMTSPSTPPQNQTTTQQTVQSDDSKTKTFRADISEVGGDYEVLGLYEVDSKGDVIGTIKKSKQQKKPQQQKKKKI
jgi:hypothetical protein